MPRRSLGNIPVPNHFLLASHRVSSQTGCHHDDVMDFLLRSQLWHGRSHGLTILTMVQTAMRHTFIVTYDICDPKRLRKVFKTLRNCGDHLQLSVFECQLSATDLLQLRDKLSEIINHAHDQVLFVNLGPSDGRGERVIEAMGLPYQAVDAPCMVV